jgi:hypothetical protein
MATVQLARPKFCQGWLTDWKPRNLVTFRQQRGMFQMQRVGIGTSIYELVSIRLCIVGASGEKFGVG